MKVVQIKKTARNGVSTHYLVFLDDRSKEGIDYEVEEWAANDLSGNNYGYTVNWELVDDESEIQTVLNIKIRVLEDKISRLTDEKEKIKSHLKLI